MGEKIKGKKSGQEKKPKTPKQGNRPHEQRARDTIQKAPA
jgi:hypothetical protein